MADPFTLLAHAIGLISLVLFAISYQYSDPKRVLLFQVLAGVVITVHFLLLGVYTAALINLVMAVRSYAYYRYKARTSWLLPVVFAVVLTVLTVVSWQGPISLLPLTGGLISTYALWQISAQRMRIFMLPVVGAWTVHNVLVGSPTAVASDIIGLSSIVVGLWRYRRSKGTVQKTP